MSYQGGVAKIRATAEKQVLEAYRWYGLGRITQPQFVQLASALVAQANNTATALADLSLSAELVSVTGTAHTAAGTLPKAYDQKRLAKGITTLLDDVAAGDDITDRLKRFASSEPLTAATNTFSEGVSSSSTVEGWVRQMDGDPCQLCRWWWREGQVWNKDTRMQHHKGCACTQRIVPIPKKVTTK